MIAAQELIEEEPDTAPGSAPAPAMGDSHVTLTGPHVDRMQIVRLERRLLAAASRGSDPNVCVDFSNVTYFPTTGLGVLTRVQRLLRDRGGRLRIVGLDDNLRRMFAVTRLDSLFEFSE